MPARFEPALIRRGARHRVVGPRHGGGRALRHRADRPVLPPPHRRRRTHHLLRLFAAAV